MKKEQMTQGFTLVEIMIVVAIIGILAAIAIPNFIKSRETSQKNACIANLKQINGAVEQCKLDGTPAPGSTDIVGATLYIKEMPKCPTSKTAYTVIDPPVCPGTVAGHVL